MRDDRDDDAATGGPGSPPAGGRVTLRNFGIGLAIAAMFKVAMTFLLGLTLDPTATFITVSLGIAGVLLYLSAPSGPPGRPE